ncbi:MAG: NUDIX hydrolase [Bacteroidia bacterium]|nr:NUDIX hydrolase [Bacteroidia bacterium]
MNKENKYCYDYPRPCVASDCLIINEQDEILLIQRKHPPCEGSWALPGGFLEMDETTEQCAARELLEETGVTIDVKELKHVAVFSEVNRDPRKRIISVSYLAHVSKSEVQHKAGDDASNTDWHKLDQLPVMAFDHAQIIECAKTKDLF